MTDLKTLQSDGDFFRQQLGSDKGFLVTYSQMTPESVDAGDFSDGGFKDADSVQPDEFDAEDGLTAVDKAVSYLQDKGATEKSSSHFHPGVWYSAGFDTTDYRTGEETEYCYHPHNFTLDEEKAIFEAIAKR